MYHNIFLNTLVNIKSESKADCRLNTIYVLCNETASIIFDTLRNEMKIDTRGVMRHSVVSSEQKNNYSLFAGFLIRLL